MWRGGCIIRSVFLKDITSAFREQPDLENLLFSKFFNDAIHKAQPGWRDVVSKGVLMGIPTPAFSTALSFYDGLRSKDLPANLLQAQRDYFGAHTFHIKPEKATEKYKEGESNVKVDASSPFTDELLLIRAIPHRPRHPRQLDRTRRQCVCIHVPGMIVARKDQLAAIQMMKSIVDRVWLSPILSWKR